MLTLVTCVIAACDKCGNHPEIDDVVPHFADEANALVCLADYGWRALAGGRLMCDTCAAKHDCALYGHVWDEWWACRCEGQIRRHSTTSDAQCAHTVRYCERCGHNEKRTSEAETAEVA